MFRHSFTIYYFQFYGSQAKKTSINCIMLRTSAMAICVKFIRRLMSFVYVAPHIYLCFLCDIRDMMASQIFPIKGSFYFYSTRRSTSIYFTMSIEYISDEKLKTLASSKNISLHSLCAAFVTQSKV